MLARLGNVIFWAGAGFGSLCIIGAIFVHLKGDFAAVFLLVVGVVSWLIGLATRYVLSGQTNEEAFDD